MSHISISSNSRNNSSRNNLNTVNFHMCLRFHVPKRVAQNLQLCQLTSTQQSLIRTTWGQLHESCFTIPLYLGLYLPLCHKTLCNFLTTSIQAKNLFWPSTCSFSAFNFAPYCFSQVQSLLSVGHDQTISHPILDVMISLH